MGLKVRVTNSDGHYRGGLFTPDDYNHARIWNGPPGEEYQDHLYNLSDPDEPTYDRSWYLYRRAVKPELTGSEECGDLFDHTSYVVRLTPVEAKQWFKTEPYNPPSALIGFLGEPTSQPDIDQSEPVKSKKRHLTAGQQDIWDLLFHKSLMAKELACFLPGKPSESAVTKMIQRMVKNGYPIRNAPTHGYYREDAPPNDLTGHPTDSDRGPFEGIPIQS